jgi:hypothetical protein
MFGAKVGLLLLANGMLYYVFSTAIFEIIEEAERVYVISAEYKNTTVANYVNEKLTWSIFDQLSTIFYYLLSFTLFADFFLEDNPNNIGVIGNLFNIIINKGLTAEVFIWLLSLLAIVLVVRLVCQLPSWLWQRHRSIDNI